MILALDTSTQWISLALADENSVLAEHTWRTTNNHTAELAPEIERTLRASGTSTASLRAVAVALGPGSFTGIRIGMGLAKGLALAHKMDLIGVPTLDIIAFAQPLFDGTLWAVLKVGRGRIAAAQYHLRDMRWEAADTTVITTWDDLLAGTDGSNIYVCGEIDEAAHSIISGSIRLAPAALNVRRAACLAEIAQGYLEEGQSFDPSTLSPIYLKELPSARTRELYDKNEEG